MAGYLPSVFTAADAITSGLSRNQLRGARYPQVFWGVHTVSEPEDASVRALAALRVAGPMALLGSLTVLRFVGVWLPKQFEQDNRVHITMPPGVCGSANSSIIVTRSKVVFEPVEFWDVLGLMGIHPAQAWFQAARYLNLEDLVVAADSLMRRQNTIALRSEMEFVISSFPGRRGVKLARRALKLAHEGVDSPMETRLRLALVAAGLRCPEVNLPLRPRPDGPQYFLDMAYPHVKLAVEYDGAGHAATPTQIQRDRTRRREIEDAGWRIITATIADSPDWARVIASVRAALRAKSGNSSI